MLSVHQVTYHLLLHKNAYVQKITKKLEESDVPTMKSGRSTSSFQREGGWGALYAIASVIQACATAIIMPVPLKTLLGCGYVFTCLMTPQTQINLPVIFDFGCVFLHYSLTM
jgi:hypothetical protein